MTLPQTSNSLPKETIDWFNGDDLRARVYFEKYAMKDEEGNPKETRPEQTWKRVAHEIASAETTPQKRKEWEKKFEWLLNDFRFIPGGRIIFGAGQKRKVTLLNCYVVPIKEDSLEGIFDWTKEAAKTYSYGGGVGVDIGMLRPRGAAVNNSAKHSTGAVSFMEIMSVTTGTIGQHGRRGALMITLPVTHPDIEEFISVKQDLSNVQYANISIRLTNDFLKAVEKGDDFLLKYENKKKKIYVEKKVSARKIWEKIIESAWKSAEPGIIFWDNMKKYSPTEYAGMEIVSTNPCSEIPLEPYGCCCLGNVNLSLFVKNAITDTAEIDWKTLEQTIRYGVRFLDDVLDYNAEKHALPEQKESSLRSRRIGLGFTGLGDMLIQMKLRYDSPKSLKFVDKMFERIKNITYDESTNIAKEKGTFPVYDEKTHMKGLFVNELSEETKANIRKNGLRNAACLTVAPVGSGAIFAGTTSGVEPIFALSYQRRSKSLSQEFFTVYHPLVSKYMEQNGITDPKDLPDFFSTSHEILPEFRVRMQGTIQKHIDHSISSTVNLPENCRKEEVAKIYMEAWKAGCKGITVYREGSREGVLITKEQSEKKDLNSEECVTVTTVKPQDSDAWKRPTVLQGRTVRFKLQEKGSVYITVNSDQDGEVKEVFIDVGRSGGDEKADAEALGKMISLYLKKGGKLHDIIKTLKGIRGGTISWCEGRQVSSVPDAAGQALEILTDQIIEIGPKCAKCPDCEEHTLINENGCFHCTNCGYTKCS